MRYSQHQTAWLDTCHGADAHQNHQDLQKQLETPGRSGSCALRPAPVRRRPLQRRPGSTRVIHVPLRQPCGLVSHDDDGRRSVVIPTGTRKE